MTRLSAKPFAATPFAAALFGAFLLSAAPAFAMGSDDSSSSGQPNCPAGQVKDQASGKCVDKSSSLIDDNERVSYAAALAYAGRYEEAIAVLETAADKADPRVLNYLGYSHRKAGRVETGLAYYAKALAGDPNYTLAREYLGEAYVHMGKIDLARDQLHEIAARAGTDSEEFRALAEAIAAAERES
ncbi:MAG: tetratricopeptide repeat protein [Flavobacteriaceae bacterium]